MIYLVIRVSYIICKMLVSWDRVFKFESVTLEEIIHKDIECG